MFDGVDEFCFDYNASDLDIDMTSDELATWTSNSSIQTDSVDGSKSSESDTKRKKKEKLKKEVTENRLVVQPQPLAPIVRQALDVDDLSPLTFRFLFCPPAPRPDSVMTFPHHAASCLNSGDFPGLSKLLHTHLESSCDISFSFSRTKLNCRTFVELFELFNEIHPDRIMHVQNSESHGNQVAAKMHMKFTECKPLYEAVARMIKATNPVFEDYFPPTRADVLRRRLKADSKPDAEREKLEALLQSDSDIVVYGSIQMVLTLDEVTHKAIGVQMLCDFNSAHIASENCF